MEINSQRIVANRQLRKSFDAAHIFIIPAAVASKEGTASFYKLSTTHSSRFAQTGNYLERGKGREGKGEEREKEGKENERDQG